MKATKLIAFIAVAGLGLLAEGAFAQTDEETSTEETDNSFNTDENASYGEEVDPYNQSVTIDEADQSGESFAESSDFSSEPPKTERLRVYSGKHDGNNVIRDPR